MGLAAAIPLLPLLAFPLVLATGRKGPGQGAYLSIGAIALSFLASLEIFYLVYALGVRLDVTAPWVTSGGIRLGMGVLIDPLAAVMLIVVSFVSMVVQIYSIGYMHDDPLYPRFFAYLSLFSAAMLGLVVANNFVQLYVCWELVGLCSYLLIGFWFQRPSAMVAAKKAFLVTRLGDSGFLVGVLTLLFATGTAGYAGVFEKAPLLAPGLVTACALLVFSGAVGKSAQFPLHIWLPDAMEGPTPVSALIHAATMVAAGVYLVARCFPLFALSVTALSVVALTGAFTALLAATIGVLTNDFKRILAYSTISQLGYMMAGIGVGAPTAGIFHLFTHAYFKALLFLCAGSVIHATLKQDIMDMGGLRRYMPYTFWTFVVGGLALVGFPMTSGFWSKDEILAAAFQTHGVAVGKVVFGALICGVFLTAFYMTRLCVLAFLGEPRSPEVHPHESPKVMTAPLVVLGLLALVSGYVGVPSAHGGSAFGRFVALGEHHEGPPLIGLMAASALVGIGGILVAGLIYYWRVVPASALLKFGKRTGIYGLVKNKFYCDELFRALVVAPAFFAMRHFWSFDLTIVDGLVNLVGWFTVRFSRVSRAFDLIVVDGLVNLVGWFTRLFGTFGRFVQTGVVQNYLLIVFAGIVVVIALSL